MSEAASRLRHEKNSQRCVPPEYARDRRPTKLTKHVHVSELLVQQ